MTEPQRIHWQQLIAQLRTGGRSFGQISIATEISKSTLKSLSKAGQPMHKHGEILIAYWCVRMGLKRDCLPKVGEVSTETVSHDDHAQGA